MKKWMVVLIGLATVCAFAQLTVQKEEKQKIPNAGLIVTDVVFEGGADTLMDVTKRGDEADSMKILREFTVILNDEPSIVQVYVPVAAKLDPVLVKDTGTNVVWQIYAKDGRFFAKPVEE
jgi:hypothetical protein